MDLRSTLEFRSNIYPVTSKEPLDDEAFVSAISDPDALVILEEKLGGNLPNELQRWQVKKGRPCLLAAKGYRPWGTKRINGHLKVVCLCKKQSCHLYENCMERHPDVLALKGDGDGDNGDRPIPRTTTTSDKAAKGTRIRLGVEKRNATEASLVVEGSSWSPDEDKKLKELFAIHPREVLYGFFPDKEIADIEREIRKVCFSFAPKQDVTARLEALSLGGRPIESQRPAQTRSAKVQRVNARAASAKHPKANASAPKPAMTRATVRQKDRKLEESRRRRKNLHSRPWTPEEDEVVFRNYPQHGSNVLGWDRKLHGRKRESIEKRAAELGLKRGKTTGLKPESVRAIDPEKEKGRAQWEEEVLGSFYEMYGDRWGVWKRLIPWLGTKEIPERAKRLGLEKGWDYQDKRRFLENEGLDWSVEELDTLIWEYPLNPNDSKVWERKLPGRTDVERQELAELLRIPDKATVNMLTTKAARLF